jgi:MerR family mercuric resistance operon transcriptional regulator
MRGLTIGRLAKATGVNLETIRYYERIGLMPEPARTASGHRSYGSEHARRLAFIRHGRDLGFTIEDIRALLVLAAPGIISCAEVRELAAAHLGNVRRKLADLTRLEAILADTVTRCAGVPAQGCPILEMLDPERQTSLD